MLKFVAGVITTLFLVALIGGGYFWINGSGKITKPVPLITPQLSPTQFLPPDPNASASSSSFEKPVTGFVNPKSTIDAIETALRSKLYGSLASHMSASVSVTINNTTRTLNKNAVVKELSALDTAKQPWNFSSNNPIAAQLLSNDPLHFKDTFIGTTANYHAAAFAFDDVYLIRSIYITKNYRPLITK